MTPAEWVAAPLLVLGTALALVGAVGLHRFDDVFARMHAATKPVTLGVGCILFGAALVQGGTTARAGLVLAAVLQFITAPIGAHVVGRAAYRSGQRGDGYQVDELAEVVTPASDEDVP